MSTSASRSSRARCDTVAPRVACGRRRVAQANIGLTFLAHRPPHDESHYEEEHEPQEDYRLHCRSPCDALAWNLGPSV